MKKTIFVLLFLYFLQGLTAQKELVLMPIPQKMSWSKGQFRINKDLKIAILGNPDIRLYGATTRFLRRIDERAGLFFSQEFLHKNDTISSPSILFSVERPGRVQLQESESYQINITENQVLIKSETDLGAMHAIETLLQLMSADEDGFYFPTGEIVDQPRFAWRGLLLDVCRHWMPVDVVKRTLDCMALVKMNVLHLHLSEDQAFRVESKNFPKLHELASDGNYFTQEELKNLVQYAKDRGIRIVPEFDMPGHATAFLTAYPELGCLQAGTTYQLERKYGAFDPTLDPSKTATYEFISKWLEEVVAIFPDEYIHIGGDENTGVEWAKSENVKEMMQSQQLKDMMAVQTVFNQKVSVILKKLGKKMVGWDEILQPNVPKDIVIQSWRGKEALIQSAKQGYQGILSSGYYIDLIEPTDKHYNNDPIPAGANLSAAETARILGGEATMWSEHVTYETVDSRIWPRTAAIAERFWSASEVKDVDDMYRRLDIISLQLEWAGSTHLKNKQMMMRRLANGYETKALEILVDVIEPMKGYSRNKNGTMYSVFSPYTLLADVATPDAKVAREFRNIVTAYVSEPNQNLEIAIRQSLEMWKNNDDNFQILLKHAPALTEAAALSKHLSELAQTGIESLNFLSSGKKPQGDWTSLQMTKIKAAKEQGGRCELQIVGAIEELVRKAGGE